MSFQPTDRRLLQEIPSSVLETFNPEAERLGRGFLSSLPIIPIGGEFFADRVGSEGLMGIFDDFVTGVGNAASNVGDFFGGIFGGDDSIYDIPGPSESGPIRPPRIPTRTNPDTGQIERGASDSVWKLPTSIDDLADIFTGDGGIIDLGEDAISGILTTGERVITSIGETVGNEDFQRGIGTLAQLFGVTQSESTPHNADPAQQRAGGFIEGFLAALGFSGEGDSDVRRTGGSTGGGTNSRLLGGGAANSRGNNTLLLAAIAAGGVFLVMKARK